MCPYEDIFHTHLRNAWVCLQTCEDVATHHHCVTQTTNVEGLVCASMRAGWVVLTTADGKVCLWHANYECKAGGEPDKRSPFSLCLEEVAAWTIGAGDIKAVDVMQTRDRPICYVCTASGHLVTFQPW